MSATWLAGPDVQHGGVARVTVPTSAPRNGPTQQRAGQRFTRDRRDQYRATRYAQRMFHHHKGEKR